MLGNVELFYEFPPAGFDHAFTGTARGHQGFAKSSRVYASLAPTSDRFEIHREPIRIQGQHPQIRTTFTTRKSHMN